MTSREPFNGETVVLLLSRGHKSSQTKDIKKAKEIWKEIQIGSTL